MSTSVINNTTQLTRNGTTQLNRLIHALAPDTFQLDDRNLQDFITAAHQYAEMLAFYNTGDTPAGNWSNFWKQEKLTSLAITAAVDTDQLRYAFEEDENSLAAGVRQFLDGHDAVNTADPVPEGLKKLAEHVFRLAQLLEREYQQLQTLGHPLAAVLLQMIRKSNACDQDELQGALQQLVSCHKSVDDQLDHNRYAGFFQPDNRWGIPDRSAYDLIPPSVTAVTRDGLRRLFKIFWDTLFNLKQFAQRAFEAELALLEQPEDQSYRIVQPHIALFLTFLHLFRHLQDDINTLPEKHLDYYYETVLGLTRKPAEPDAVYLIFTLAKEAERQVLDKHTRLYGKAPDGQPVFFETLEDQMITKTKVEALQSVLLQPMEETPKTFQPAIDTTPSFPQQPLPLPLAKAGVKASESTMSAVTVGKKQVYALSSQKLTGAQIYSAIGRRLFVPLDSEDTGEPDPNATIGFAIASPQLLLLEGKRVVDIKINIEDTDLTKLLIGDSDPFSIYFSTKNGLSEAVSKHAEIKADNFDSDIDIQTSNFCEGYNCTISEKLWSVRIQLSNAFPPVEAEKESEKANNLPFVKIEFKADFLMNHYDVLQEMQLSAVNPISIRVAAAEIQQNLILQNDYGVFNGTERFYPFGTIPEPGAKFYVGNKEGFGKNIDKFKLCFNWINPPADISGGGYYQYYPSGMLSGSYDIDFLNKGVFDPEYRGNGNLIVEKTIQSETALIAVNALDRDPAGADGNKYTPASKRGFVRFTFKGNFLHAEYSKVLAVQSIALTSGTTSLQVDENKLEEFKDSIFTNIETTADDFKNLTSAFNASGTITIDETQKTLIKKVLTEYVNVVSETAFVAPFDVATTRRVIAFLGVAGAVKLEENDENRIVIARILKELNAFKETVVDKINKEDLDKLLVSVVSDGANATDLLPNAPYTPSTNGISLTYFTGWQVLDSDADGFYHVLPFNWLKKTVAFEHPKDEVNLISPAIETDLLKTLLAANNFPATPAASSLGYGLLFIGFSGLVPGETINLLIQVLDGSEGDQEATAPKVAWSYLAKTGEADDDPVNQKWMKFDAGDILKDGTNGLLRTGVIRFRTPENDMARRGQEEDKAPLLHWIRAALIEGESDGKKVSTDAFPQVVNISAQALEARWVAEGSDPAHLAAPLEANTVTKLATSLSAIKKIEQPLPSFGGKLPEKDTPEVFYRRISERLRHKGRAITPWDYERLLLEQFPKVAAARCLPNCTRKWPLTVPGHVTVAVIPDRKTLPGVSPQKPALSKGDLIDMQDYLLLKTIGLLGEKSPYSNGSKRLEVVNPLYELLKIDLSVRFRNGDAGAFMYKCKKALMQFICPWVYDDKLQPEFGRSIYRAQLICLLENLEFVDYVQDMTVCIDKGPEITEALIVPSSDRSILTIENTDITISEALDPTTRESQQVFTALDLAKTNPATESSLESSPAAVTDTPKKSTKKRR